MNNPSDNTESSDFDLFAPPEDDHLQEQLAKGTFQWTNKTTRILGVLLLFVATLSAGAWYGHRSANSTGASSANAFASLRAGRLNTAGGFPDPAALAAAGAAAGGFNGFSRGSAGTITKVSGKTVTITLDQDPTTPLKSGDLISLRATNPMSNNGSNSAPVITPGASSGSTSKSAGGQKKVKSKSNSIPTPTDTSAAQPGGPRGPGGGRGFNNPAFTACLAKEGVALDPGTRPDRTDPKIATALQKCFATLGGPGGGTGGPGFGNRPGGGAGTLSTPTPAPSN
jgi:hypothetical protein